MYPKFLDNHKKWSAMVEYTSNMTRYNHLVNKLFEENLSVYEFYAILYGITKDIYEKHQNPEILEVLEYLKSLIKLLMKYLLKNALEEEK